MERPIYYVFCTNCQKPGSRYRPVRLLHFYFDHEGDLHIEGICGNCLVQLSLTHTANEIAEDVAVVKEMWQQEMSQLTEDEVRKFAQGLNQMGILEELNPDDP